MTEHSCTGFRGGINWYRNMDRNNELISGRGKRPIAHPCLMLTAEWDFVLPPRLAEGLPAMCSDLEMQMIPKAGHWVQQEFPAEVSRLVIDWLQRRFPSLG